MKKKIRFYSALAIILSIAVMIHVNTVESEAAYEGKTTWDCYTCLLPGHNYLHHVIYFTGYGDASLGKVYSGNFTGYNCHWPASFEYGNTWTHQLRNAGHAYGNYTIRTSIINFKSFVALTVREDSRTKSVSFIKG